MKHIFALLNQWLVIGGLFLWLSGGVAYGQASTWQTAVGINQAVGSESQITATATDAGGNVYVAGQFRGTIQVGSITLVGGAWQQLFVAKWNAASGMFAWAQQTNGTTGGIDARALAVSGSSIYVGGTMSNTVTFGNISLTSGGSNEAYVAKLTDAGSTGSFTWVQRTSGRGLSVGTTDALAVSGTTVYVAGGFQGTVAFGNSSPANAGSYDAYVAKLTDAGSTAAWGWVQPAGGGGADAAVGLTVSGTNVYVAGYFASSTASFGSANLTNTNSWQEGFVAKLTDVGSSASFVWTQQVAGDGIDIIRSVALSGNALYIAGYTTGISASFGATTLFNTAPNTYHLFVAKLTDAGPTGSFGWAMTTGRSGINTASAVAVNGANVYVTGSFSGEVSFGSNVLTSILGPVLNPGPGTPPGTLYPTSDVFVAKLADAGVSSAWAWAQPAGGRSGDGASALALAPNGLVYAAGGTTPPATFGALTVAGTANNGVGFLASLTDPTLTATTASLSPEGISIFPNPAHGRAIIQLPPATTATLTLLDALGRTLRTQTAPTNARAELDLTGLAPGLYALRVRAGAETATRRLVVE